MSPPTTLFSLTHTNLFFFVPASKDTDPLYVLEFLRKLIDIFEEFIGAPLLAGKIETNYDVVAQLLTEMCDAGNVCNTEPDALREVVNMPGFIDSLLGGLGLQGYALPPRHPFSTPSFLRRLTLTSSAPSLSSNPLQTQLARRPMPTGPAIPWRKSNVKHTSNELYVDIVETLLVTLAPSGRPLAAYANGSILFNAKISGVPDLLLNITTPSGKHTVDRVLEMPTFHPCVRLARWKERPGEFSFVPPDGKFMLAGYQVNLMPDTDFENANARNLNVPVLVEVEKSLGPVGLDFEVRLLLSPPGSAHAPSRGGFGGGGPGPAGTRGSGRSTPSLFGSGASSSSQQLRDVVVTIPVPPNVRNISELRASRGEASFSPVESSVEWRIPTKEAADPGNARLRCTVVGPLAEDDSKVAAAAAAGFDAANGEYEYDEEADAEGYQGEISGSYQSGSGMGGEDKGKGKGKGKEKEKTARQKMEERDKEKVEKNRSLMPTSATISFSVKGWLASGIKVDSLTVDTRRSRGLGDGIKPVKGVKYLTISKQGIETRC